MIYITGDTHGVYDRFCTKSIIRKLNIDKQTLNKLAKDDYIIICGDFGIWANDDRHNYMLDWLNNKPFTTLFVDGNHENYDLLKTFDIVDWNGGKVQFIRPSIIHLMRGQLYNIDGNRIFTMGGAQSHDIQGGVLERGADDFDVRAFKAMITNRPYRVNHESWWKEELPSDLEYAEAISTLEKCNWDVDYIITHCAPTSIVSKLWGTECSGDKLTNFFDTISEKCKFKRWYFGHYHDNVKLCNNKYVLLYSDIEKLQ